MVSSRAMKIAHIITRLIIGGAQENTVLTCEGLADRGHEVTLFAGPETGPEGSLWPRAERGGYRLERVSSLRRAIRPRWEWQSASALIRALRAGSFDVVHTHSSKAGILGRYSAHRAGVPHVVHTIHGMSFNRTQPPAVRALYRTLERRAARWTDAFITVADAMTEQSVAARLAPRERFRTVRSGIEVSDFRPDPALRREVRASWGIPDDAPVVGTVARLFRNKGYESVLRVLPLVARACPDVRFVWVGDGADRDAYVAAMARRGLADRLHLTGLVDPTEVPRLVGGFDVLLHASRWEGLARVLVQAALMEVPSVTYDLDGAREVVEHGVTGRLAPSGDVEALARHVQELLSDDTRRRSLGAEGRRRCLVAFDARKMVEDIERVYEELSGASRPSVTAPAGERPA